MRVKMFLRLAVFNFMLLLVPAQAFADSDVCEAPAEVHKKKMERFMMKDVPSILDDCGLGQLLNFCNNPYLKLIGKAMGLCGGVDIGMGEISSNFCGIGFKLPDINSIYITQRTEIQRDFHEQQSSMIAKRYAQPNDDEGLGLNVGQKQTNVVASADQIKTALGI